MRLIMANPEPQAGRIPPLADECPRHRADPQLRICTYPLGGIVNIRIGGADGLAKTGMGAHRIAANSEG